MQDVLVALVVEVRAQQIETNVKINILIVIY